MLNEIINFIENGENYIAIDHFYSLIDVAFGRPHIWSSKHPPLSSQRTTKQATSL